MLSDISNQLTQVMEKRRLKDKLERDLHQVEQNLAEKSRLLTTLGQLLKKEQVDVENMERFSLTGLFYSVLGSREQQVEKERQELLSAQLKYQQAKQAVDTLQADQSHLKKQLNGLRGVEEQCNALLASKESILRQANPQIAGELVHLSEQIANRNAEKREIDEAIAAATAVLAPLDQVIDSLQSAEGWGTWDMLGGGFLSTTMKHSRIDDACEVVQNVQAKMNRFTCELSDVQRSTDLKIEISDLDVFADHFFDGLIIDWIVQSKIQDSLEQARLAKESIVKAVADLDKLRVAAIYQAQRLNMQRTSLIEQA